MDGRRCNGVKFNANGRFLLRLLPLGPPMRDTRTAVPDLDESVVGSILRWWAMWSDSDESRQPKLLDFAGPVGPLRDEAQLLNGPNMVGQVRICGLQSWRPDLEAFVIVEMRMVGVRRELFALFLNNLFQHMNTHYNFTFTSLFDGIRVEFLKILIML